MHQIVMPKTTLTGYRQHVDYEPVEPKTLTRTQFNKLTQAQQDTHDEQRRIWFGDDMTFTTAKSTELVQEARGLLRTRSPLSGGQRNIVLDGPAAIGKTTTLFRLAKMMEAKAAKQNPNYRADGEVPVVYVEVPPRATPKSIGAQILDFFEYDYNRRSSPQDQILGWAQDQLVAHRTRLLIFDELQMLRLDGRTGDDAINVLKKLMNNVSCLVLFAGIDLQIGLASQAARQIMARCRTVSMEPFSPTDEGRAHWHRLVQNFGKEMRLLDAPPDHLQRFADPLLIETGGSIGALRRVLARAMDIAIEERDENGREFITPEMLFPDTVVAGVPQPPSTTRSRGKKAA